MSTKQTTDIEFLKQWIGRREVISEWLAPFPARAMAATLGETTYPAEGEVLPPLWHWLYFHFQPVVTPDRLGSDGHPKRGDFLPPVVLPRRMFAGARFEFCAPLRVGERAERRSEVRNVELKSGRNGEMVFVTVRQEIHNTQGLALIEEQDIVYREPPTASASSNASSSNDATEQSKSADSRKQWCVDEVMLFRYSALTFNGHRIHYDQSYATQVEGYPCLVVQGPLTATLLATRIRELFSDRHMTKFRFRAMQPLFNQRPFNVCVRTCTDGSIDLWAEDEAGCVAMQANATFEG